MKDLECLKLSNIILKSPEKMAHLLNIEFPMKKKNRFQIYLKNNNVLNYFVET